MKKLLICIVFATLAYIVVVIPNRTDMTFVESGEVTFIYYNKDIQAPLSDTDRSSIVSIFQGKLLFSDLPSCGFDETVSIQFNNGTETFCIACDGCGLIYWENKNKYFKLSEQEKTELHDILRAYGFTFPCV